MDQLENRCSPRAPVGLTLVLKGFEAWGPPLTLADAAAVYRAAPSRMTGMAVLLRRGVTSPEKLSQPVPVALEAALTRILA